MCANLPIPGFDIGCIYFGQSPSDASMEITPPNQGKFIAGDFAQAVVREIVLGDASALKDAPLPQFVKCAGNAVSSQSIAFSNNSKENGRPITLAKPASS